MSGHMPPAWTGISFVKTIHSSAPDYLQPSKQQLKANTVVCITGASRGIGAATAKSYAEAGAAGLILTARSEKALEQTVETCSKVGQAGVKIIPVGADVGSADASRQIKAAIESNFGRLDILINNAGIMCTDESAFDKLESQDDEQFVEVTNVNYIGRLRLIKALAPLMRSTPNGAKIIVNLSSMSAHFTLGTPMAFNISELANNRLSESLAEMYADDGFLVHAVHPGAVKTTPPPGLPQWMQQFCQDDVGLCGAFLVWLTKEPRFWLSGRYLSSNWDVQELEQLQDEIVQGDKLKMRMVV